MSSAPRPGPVAPWVHTRTARTPLTGRQIRQAIGRGVCLRCPVCGVGKLFRTYLRMNEECPRCGVGFARESGQWLGSMDLNLTLSLLVLLLPLVFLPELGLARQLEIWGAGAVLLPLLLFRHIRGFWTALVFLSGGVY